MRAKFNCAAVCFMLVMTSFALPATEIPCDNVPTVFGCSTHDAMNCTIEKVSDLKDLLERTPWGPTQSEIDQAVLEVIEVADAAEHCPSQFAGWAWTNAMLAVLEVMVHDEKISPEVEEAFDLIVVDRLNTPVSCGAVSPHPLQNTRAEEFLGEYLLAELGLLFHEGVAANLRTQSATCVSNAFRETGGAERNILRVGEGGEELALIFNHKQENPYYGFAVLNALAVAKGAANQFGRIPYSRPSDFSLVRGVYNWLSIKSRNFTSWQDPDAPAVVSRGRIGPILSQLDGGGCLDLCNCEPDPSQPNNPNCYQVDGDWFCKYGLPKTEWPRTASGVTSDVWDDVRSCYSSTEGISADCDASYDPAEIRCRDYLGYPTCFPATIDRYVGTNLDAKQCGDLTTALSGVDPEFQPALEAKYKVFYERWGRAAISAQWASPAITSFDDYIDDHDSAPDADFWVSCPSLTCSFSNTSVDDFGIVSSFWIFGDGTTSSQTNPSHTYPEGIYTVNLMVTDARLQYASSVQTVTVDTTAPEGNFNVKPIAGSIRVWDHFTFQVAASDALSGVNQSSVGYRLAGVPIQPTSLVWTSFCRAWPLFPPCVTLTGWEASFDIDPLAYQPLQDYLFEATFSDNAGNVTTVSQWVVIGRDAIE